MFNFNNSDRTEEVCWTREGRYLVSMGSVMRLETKETVRNFVWFVYF